MPLTEFEIKNARQSKKVTRMKDSHGLYLEIRPSGKKVWRMRYWIKGKENTLTFGDYPLVSLKEARQKRDGARRLLVDNIDPAVERDIRKLDNTAPTFADIAIEWMGKKKAENKSEKYLYALGMRLEKYVLPYIGNAQPDEVGAPRLLGIIRRIEENGTFETAHRVLNLCGMVFRYGVATGRASRDPSGDLRDALVSHPVRHLASIRDTKALGGLLRAIHSYPGSIAVRFGLVILSLTFLRSQEIRHAVWPEIDLEKAEWFIPAPRMKMKRDHLVPLSRQAVEAFAELRGHTGHGKHVFPSVRTRSGSRPLSDLALLTALRTMGYGPDEMTVHGFRHTASTLLNESGMWSGDAIERQLAHVEKNKIR
ncbi:MAG: integrase arm-type DNA-binding domain-containing protein, partial [Synergistaceae bacterium]|nr:integrase arm-type DNA-binding domain-containing protein [Synergistaceae bacterium]